MQVRGGIIHKFVSFSLFLKGLQVTKHSVNILKRGKIGQPNTTNLNRNVVTVTKKNTLTIYFN